jgi:hypothetical protein
MPQAQTLVLKGYQLFSKFAEFKASIEPDVEAVRRISAQVDERYQEIAKSFGDDPKKADVVQWLGGVAGFLRGLTHANEENEAREKARLEQERRAAEGDKRKPKPDLTGLVPQATQRGILDELEKRFARGVRRS